MALSQREVILDMMSKADAMIQASNEEYINALLERYTEFEQRVSADILRIHSQLFGGSTPQYADFIQFQGDDKVARVIASEIHRLNGDVNESLLAELESQYRDAYNMSAWVLDVATPPNIEPVYKMPPETVIRAFVSEPWAGAMFSQRIGAINGMMAQDIQQAVTQAMFSGDSTDDLAKRISSVIGTPDSDFKYRSKVIARTELLRLANQVRGKVWKDNSDILDGSPIWVARALTSVRLCEECAERAGKTMDYIEVEIYPYQDLELWPPGHPNCGCTTMPNIKSWEELMAPSIGGKLGGPIPMSHVSVLEPMPAEEWLNNYVTSDERGNI